MSQTPAQLHEELVAFAAETYKQTLTDALVWMFQGGQIPGIKMLSGKQLRSFFSSTDPAYWATLPPEEAHSQLQQWQQAGGDQGPQVDVGGEAPIGPG